MGNFFRTLQIILHTQRTACILHTGLIRKKVDCKFIFVLLIKFPFLKICCILFSFSQVNICFFNFAFCYLLGFGYCTLRIVFQYFIIEIYITNNDDFFH